MSCRLPCERRPDNRLPVSVPGAGLAKAAVNQAERPLDEGLREEAFLFQQLLRNSGSRSAMRRFLEIGGQTREGELRVGELNAEIGADE